MLLSKLFIINTDKLCKTFIFSTGLASQKRTQNLDSAPVGARKPPGTINLTDSGGRGCAYVNNILMLPLIPLENKITSLKKLMCAIKKTYKIGH